MKETRLVLGSVRFEKSVILNAGAGSSLSWGTGGRWTSDIQKALLDVSGRYNRTDRRSTHAISPTAKYALHVHKVIQGSKANQMHATRTARMLNTKIEKNC
jgi:hypothetical protein